MAKYFFLSVILLFVVCNGRLSKFLFVASQAIYSQRDAKYLKFHIAQSAQFFQCDSHLLDFSQSTTKCIKPLSIPQVSKYSNEGTLAFENKNKLDLEILNTDGLQKENKIIGSVFS